MSVTLQLDTREFARALREYAKVSKKDLTTIVNTKAFYIARGAARNNFKADKKVIDAYLNQLVKVEKADAARRGVEPRQAPLVGVIVEKKAKAKLGRGYSPAVPEQLAEFRKEVKKFLGRKHSAIAFMASGWKPAIKRLAAAIGASSMSHLDRRGKNYDWSKFGGGSPAIEGEKLTATLWNAALNPDTIDQSGEGERLEKYAGGALQDAINAEVRSMDAEVSKRLQAEANKRASKFLS